MATRTSSRIDLQKVVSGAAELEVKALLAGVEYLQVWIGQAAKLASIANDTLQAIRNDKASLADTARRLTEFGKQNAEVFGDLSSRMSRSYYNELGRLANVVDAKAAAPARAVAVGRKVVGRKTGSARKAARRKPAARRAGRKA